MRIQLRLNEAKKWGPMLGVLMTKIGGYGCREKRLCEDTVRSQGLRRNWLTDLGLTASTIVEKISFSCLNHPILLWQSWQTKTMAHLTLKPALLRNSLSIIVSPLKKQRLRELKMNFLRQLISSSKQDRNLSLLQIL